MTGDDRRPQALARWRVLLASAVLSGAAAAGEPPAAAGAYRFVALPCVQLDMRCPTQFAGPGLAVAAAPPPTEADLVSLLKAPPLAAGDPAPPTPWLVAVGPLQGASQAEAGPRLRSLKVEGQSLMAELDYQPYSAVGEQRRRFVPSYPVAYISLPALPSGTVRLSVRWTARDASAVVTPLGPLLLLVP